MTPQLDGLGIIVQDMPTALNFYRQLGWDIPPEMDAEGHVEYKLPNGLHIMWDTHAIIHSFEPNWQPASGGRRMGLAFACVSPAEVDATFARLTDLGYQAHATPFDAVWQQRYAQILDPDGNVIDLFAPLA